MAGRYQRQSTETIMTFENRDISQWSAVWSTGNIPGAGATLGTGGRPPAAGRMRLRIAALSLGAFFTMHCKVAAAALTGGFFLFLVFLIISIVVLANPLRHFEVYLGQWSISGPGRAFRIIPMLDGIGIAFCINTIVRAITCCTVAAISAVYLINSLSDEKLPFTYCRNFQLKTYNPLLKEVTQKRLFETRLLNNVIFSDWRRYELSQHKPSTGIVGLSDYAWRNKNETHKANMRKIEVCNETYAGGYPALFNSPAYNYFYVEVMHLRPDYHLLSFNIKLIWSIIGSWLVIWLLLISERIQYGRPMKSQCVGNVYGQPLDIYITKTHRSKKSEHTTQAPLPRVNLSKLVWNKTYRWLVVVPLIWAIVLLATAIGHFSLMQYKLKYAFRVGAKETLVAMGDALEVAIYIHAAGLGTELIHGKGLNHYASGHIDPFLNNDNVWHSGLLFLITALHSGGASACAFVDYLQFEVDQRIHNMRESTLWIIPMYSKCVSQGSYSHLSSSIVFGGFTFSYLAVAYTLIKTALHIIFEYKVKLVFIEQTVVAFLIVVCLGLSLFFATNGGVVLLESIDSVMTTVATPIIVLLELVAMVYVYRNRDFQSDMSLAMEDNACGSRMSTQWQIIPFITLGTLILKIYMLATSELPRMMVLLSLLPLLAVLGAVPLRAVFNIYLFLRRRRHSHS